MGLINTTTFSEIQDSLLGILPFVLFIFVFSGLVKLFKKEIAF